MDSNAITGIALALALNNKQFDPLRNHYKISKTHVASAAAWVANYPSIEDAIKADGLKAAIYFKPFRELIKAVQKHTSFNTKMMMALATRADMGDLDKAKELMMVKYVLAEIQSNVCGDVEQAPAKDGAVVTALNKGADWVLASEKDKDHTLNKVNDGITNFVTACVVWFLSLWGVHWVLMKIGMSSDTAMGFALLLSIYCTYKFVRAEKG